tara:strand:+ start:1337 stop:1495 length:159 start_codon:yes stop_codon:yes gene_type:complete
MKEGGCGCGCAVQTKSNHKDPLIKSNPKPLTIKKTKPLTVKNTFKKSNIKNK